jgi:hypothetical protein
MPEANSSQDDEKQLASTRCRGRDDLRCDESVRGVVTEEITGNNNQRALDDKSQQVGARINTQNSNLREQRVGQGKLGDDDEEEKKKLIRHIPHNNQPKWDAINSQTTIIWKELRRAWGAKSLQQERSTRCCSTSRCSRNHPRSCCSRSRCCTSRCSRSRSRSCCSTSCCSTSRS